MWYKDRLAAGLPIGSGLIEGGCKNIIGARLKLNNARWRIRRSERIGMLRCVEASEQWANFLETSRLIYPEMNYTQATGTSRLLSLSVHFGSDRLSLATNAEPNGWSGTQAKF